MKFISACILIGGIKCQLNNEDDIYFMDDLKKKYYSLKCYFTIYNYEEPQSHTFHYLKIAKKVSLLNNTRKLHF